LKIPSRSPRSTFKTTETN